MRPLDAILVIPADEEKVYQKGLGTSPAKEPPVFGRWIASYLLSRGYGVDIIDQAADNLSCDSVDQYYDKRLYVDIARREIAIEPY